MARTFTTDADIRDDVIQTLDASAAVNTSAAYFDVDGIVREIVATVGVDGYADMDEKDFWLIVERHDRDLS